MEALLLIAAHMMGDYVAQTNWMSANKFYRFKTANKYPAWGIRVPVRVPTKVFDRFWFHTGVRTIHVLAYTACFAAALLFIQPEWQNAVWFLGLLFALHWLTDCRRWASPDPWPPKPIMVDQSLHAVQIAVLAFIFLR